MNKKDRIINLIKDFKEKHIAVIGDIMLDRFLMGESSRISPEAPVPVVRVLEETIAPGGAANVAANIRALSAEVSLIGIVGSDSVSKELASLLKSKKILTDGMLKIPGRVTTEKVRLISLDKQIVRVDKEVNNSIDSKIEGQLADFLHANINKWDGLVVSDYAKGVITPVLARVIVKLAKRFGRPLVVDVKPQNLKYFRSATVVVPNIKEALQAAGVESPKSAGRALQRELNCHVLITCGHEGMILFCGNRIRQIPAVERKVFDVIGAGDTVAAGLVLSLACGISLFEAAKIANLAASIVVGKVGTAVVSAEELASNTYRLY